MARWNVTPRTYDEDALNNLANAVIWAADHMFANNMDAVPAALVERLIALIGRDRYLALVAQRDAAASTAA